MYLKGLSLRQIDDLATGPRRGLFREFFARHLPSYASQLVPLESGSAAEEGADLAILGLGLNGHVAFHEPGLDPRFFAGCVRLSAETCQNLAAGENAWGISYGIEAFRRTRAILMMAYGPAKHDIVQRLLARDPALPATHLLGHPDFTLLTAP